jgi:outer membrane biosynthesis protein TonB
LFDAAAVVAARHWRGVPTIRDGKPAETITFQPIYFNHPRNPLPLDK